MSENGRTPPMHIDASLQALYDRLEALSLEPGFLAQRQLALSRALRPYAEYRQRLPLQPFPEEAALAVLYLYADFYPEDGQFSLVEQVRDLIEVHVPEQERAWLDPLHHSYMDLLTMTAADAALLTLRSLGDGREFTVAAGAFGPQVTVGQVLLTRLIRLPGRTVPAGAAVVLSAASGQAIYEAANDWRREMEAGSGSFDLGEWQEFAKRYGYTLLWQVAQARLAALIRTDDRVAYCAPNGQLFLYALALYEHHEFRFLSEGLSQMEGIEAESGDTETGGRGDAAIPASPLRPIPVSASAPPSPQPAIRTWVHRAQGGAVVARLTLTPSELVVECDSAERLDALKHRLASSFGYALHFRGESTTVPAHDLPLMMDLTKDEAAPAPVIVSTEEEHRLLSSFLESIYLEWTDRPSPILGGQTPRHTAASPKTSGQVADLIAQLERNDLARRRTGKAGYDYNRLRAHVGLQEVSP
ncbi:MAG: hypothetical protein FJ249_01540 [Nitrospira sp.]|nr:hypothetical protein [Nitrospira sp.]